MALEVSRIYKNAATDIVRVDTMYMRANSNALTTGVQAKTYYREFSTSLIHEPADRVVASIQIITGADEIETVSGDFTYVKWTDRNLDVGILCDMSDLPGVGDTV